VAVPHRAGGRLGSGPRVQTEVAGWPSSWRRVARAQESWPRTVLAALPSTLAVSEGRSSPNATRTSTSRGRGGGDGSRRPGRGRPSGRRPTAWRMVGRRPSGLPRFATTTCGSSRPPAAPTPVGWDGRRGRLCLCTTETHEPVAALKPWCSHHRGCWSAYPVACTVQDPLTLAESSHRAACGSDGTTGGPTPASPRGSEERSIHV
jgi:hypothetical protein